MNEDDNVIGDEDEPVQGATRINPLQAIKAMLAKGEITNEQAKEFRRTIGVDESSFTKKQKTKSQRKVLRTMQKESRRKNRGLGRGQRQSGRR